MREALIESYHRRDTATRLMQEAIDMSVEEPDHARWYLMGNAGANEPTVGDGAIAKDLLAPNAALIRKQAFLLYYSSPFARGVVRTMRKFIFGRGVKTTVMDENESRKEKAEQYLKDWADANSWDVVQKESGDRTFRDGEIFWHNRWIAKKEIPRLELTEPDDVRSDKENASHGIELDPKDATQVLRYHIRGNKGDKEGFTVDAEDMEHVKINVDSNMKRGRSLFEPVFKYFEWHEDWLKSRIVLNKVRSAVALVRHVEGVQQQGQMIRKPTESNRAATAGRAGSVRMFRSGSILTAGPGVKYEMLSANLGASDAAQDGRNILLAIAVGVGFPEMFLTGNFENSNYSSSLTAQNPFVREFEDWQDFFDFHIRRLMKRVLELGIEAGLVAKGTSLEVKNEFPQLVHEDFVQMSTALGQLYLNEVISGHTYAVRMGFDYEEEQELRQQEQAALGLGDEEDLDGEEEEEETENVPLLQSESTEEDDLEEAARPIQGVGTKIRVGLAHQKKNVRKREALQRKIDRGEHHTRTMQSLNRRHAKREDKIKKLQRKHAWNDVLAGAARPKRTAGGGPASPTGMPRHRPLNPFARRNPVAGDSRVGGMGPDTLNRRIARRMDTGAPVGGDVAQIPAYSRYDPRSGKEIQVSAHPRHIVRGRRVDEIENILRNGTLVDSKPLGGGVEVTYVGKMEHEGESVPVVFKKLNEDRKPNRAENEAAAVAVARELGLGEHVGAVVVRHGVKYDQDNAPAKGAIVEFLNGDLKIAAKFSNNPFEARPSMDVLDNNTMTVAKLAVYDYLIGNHDRHQNNWLTDNSGQFRLIDHERSFTDTGIIYDSHFINPIKPGMGFTVKHVIGNSWDNKWPALQAAMKRAGLLESKINQTKRRFDKIMTSKNKDITDLNDSGLDALLMQQGFIGHGPRPGRVRRRRRRF